MRRTFWWWMLAVGLLAVSAGAAPRPSAPALTRWMDPLGQPRLAHAVPSAAGLLAGRQLDAAGASSGSNRVCLVVHSNVLAAVSNSLDRYQQALSLEGFTPLLYRYDSGSAANLRSYLAGLHAASNSLAGAVLIGEIPYVLYEMTDDFGIPDEYEDFPCDLYYMDLNGSWLDLTNTPPFASGKYDSRSGNLDLEIWVSRIKIAPLTSLGDSTGVLLNYLDKNLRYRARELVPHRRALVYVDDDWAGDTTTDAENLSRLYGDIHTVPVMDIEITRMSDYTLHRMTNRFELFFVRSHGYPAGHGFYQDAKVYFYYVHGSDYISQHPSALFYSFFVCSGSDFTETDYLAGIAAFNGGDSGLASWGSTKTGGMWNEALFYQRLAEGQPLGQAFKDWFNDFQEPSGAASWFSSWFYGMVLIGDGSLTLSRTDSGPNQCTIGGSGLSSQWSAIQGGRYLLQACSNLAAPVWTTLGTVTAADYAVTLTDPNPAAGSRAYRVVKDESGPSNLLRNASLEMPGSSDATARYWTDSSPDDRGGIWGNASRETWRSHDGQWEGTVKTTWGGTATNLGGWWQEAAVTARTTYQASAWFWADNTWTAAVQEFKIEFYDNSTFLLSSNITLHDVRQDWTQKVITATAPIVANAAHIVINVSGAGSAGALQFDDVELKKVP